MSEKLRKTDNLNPGDKWIYRHICDCEFLVVLLSSDVEPGVTDFEKWWRCAEFQICSNGNLLGAQIVLHTVHEIYKMEYSGGLKNEGDIDYAKTKRKQIEKQKQKQNQKSSDYWEGTPTL